MTQIEYHRFTDKEPKFGEMIYPLSLSEDRENLQECFDIIDDFLEGFQYDKELSVFIYNVEKNSIYGILIIDKVDMPTAKEHKLQDKEGYLIKRVILDDRFNGVLLTSLINLVSVRIKIVYNGNSYLWIAKNDTIYFMNTGYIESTKETPISKALE